MAEREEARRDGRLKARFLSYRLNLPTADESEVLLTVPDWERTPARDIPERVGATAMADDILHQLTRDNALIAMQNRYDEPDDASQKLGKYFSHILAFSISNSGLQIL